jgi:hypothetical protein
MSGDLTRHQSKSSEFEPYLGHSPLFQLNISRINALLLMELLNQHVNESVRILI